MSSDYHLYGLVSILNKGMVFISFVLIYLILYNSFIIEH